MMNILKKILRPFYWVSVSICIFSLLQIFLSWNPESGGALIDKSFWSIMLFPFGSYIALVEFVSGFEPLRKRNDWSLVFKELENNNNV